MEVRQGVNKRDFAAYSGERIREELLIENVFGVDKINLVYSHIDRIIVGGVIPKDKNGVALTAGNELRAEYFLERREMGAINIGGKGYIVADGKKYELEKGDCLYLGRGTKEVAYFSDNAENPAQFYLNSCPAHKEYATKLIAAANAVHVKCGKKEDCNERTINKYILPGNCDSCQLVMGMTKLEQGSVWNTMPCHTHERRMEVYLYFDIKPENVVFHFAGDPSDTRHVVIKDRQAVFSPSFSIHSGVGTSDYTFIWGMCGENQDFDDMDGVKTTDLK